MSVMNLAIRVSLLLSCMVLIVFGATAQQELREPINDAANRVSESENRMEDSSEFRSRFPFDRQALSQHVLEEEQARRLDPFDPNENWLDYDRYIVNGNAVLGFAAVGALLIDKDGVSKTFCSGTMIGCSTFLTANHCLVDTNTESVLSVFLQSEGIISVDAVLDPHEDYDAPYADLALLQLRRPVQATMPLRLNTPDTAIDADRGEIVGFGHTGRLSNDSGIKRTGKVTMSSCNDPRDGLICWDFDGSEPESSTCNMDSGGPIIFRGDDDVPRLSGVISETDANCAPRFQSVNVDVTHFLEFLKDEGGDDVGKQDCGVSGEKLVGDNFFLVGERFLEPDETHTLSYDIPNLARTIRVTLNGQDSFNLDFDLNASIVQAGGTVSSCSKTGPQNFESCDLPVPDGDSDVFVSVSLVSGSFAGSYQVTVTAF